MARDGGSRGDLEVEAVVVAVAVAVAAEKPSRVDCDLDTKRVATGKRPTGFA